jgi:hypothetical protein
MARRSKILYRTIELTQPKEDKDKGKANVSHYPVADQTKKVFHNGHGSKWGLIANQRMAFKSLPQSLAQMALSLTTPYS